MRRRLGGHLTDEQEAWRLSFPLHRPSIYWSSQRVRCSERGDSVQTFWSLHSSKPFCRAGPRQAPRARPSGQRPRWREAWQL